MSGRKWQLNINVTKCNILHLGKKNPKFSYFINNNIIHAADHVRDLGVEIDSNLVFNYHINNILTKAYQRIAVLFKGFVFRDSRLLTKAYVVFVRPILEYCSSVWSPFKIADIDAIEKVQKYFTRKLYGLNTFCYKDRLFILDLESLELRRLKFDLIMYFKIFNNFVDMDSSVFFKLSKNVYNVRTENKLKLHKPAFGNNNFENSFAIRCIDCWNWLPDDVINSASVSIFKQKLNNLNFDKFLKGRALGDI